MSCGTLRAGVPACRATQPTYVVVSGRGTVYCYVVHHHPPVPGKELPFVVVLVELAEGVRMVGELLDAVPDDVEIGAAGARSTFDARGRRADPARPGG